jgi:hypothetical protein
MIKARSVELTARSILGVKPGRDDIRHVSEASSASSSLKVAELRL